MEKEIIKIKKAPSITCELEDKEYPKYIIDFISKMNKFDLSKFYNNLKTVEISSVKKGETDLPNAGAEYDVFSNIIHYQEGTLNTNIMHELLHMSTRVQDGERTYCGFMQVLYNGKGFGYGLNEGFTAKIDDKYFGKYTKQKEKEINYIYPTTKYICAMLDYLLGHDHMEELYMNADLAGLYKELSFYSSPRKAYEFILRVDRIFDAADRKSIPNVFKVNALYDDILFFISECFLTKFRIMYVKKELTDEEYERCLGFVRYIMGNNLSYFKVLNSRKLTKYYDKLNNKVIEKVDKKSRVK